MSTMTKSEPIFEETLKENGLQLRYKSTQFTDYLNNPHVRM